MLLLIWRHHAYWWRAPNLGLCLALTAYEWGEIFVVTWGTAYLQSMWVGRDHCCDMGYCFIASALVTRQATYLVSGIHTLSSVPLLFALFVGVSLGTAEKFSRFGQRLSPPGSVSAAVVSLDPGQRVKFNRYISCVSSVFGETSQLIKWIKITIL